MTQVLTSLGVFIVWVDKGLAESGIDGACTRNPRPAVLIKAGTPWRARMTMAHELAHLIYDLTEARPVLLSPRIEGPSRPKGPTLPRWVDDIEQSANAFAAALLAPAEKVSQLVSGLDPSAEDAIARIGEHFALGRTTAINRLCDIYRLTESQRAEMQGRRHQHYKADFSGDALPKKCKPRGEPFLSVVGKALIAKVVSPSVARRMLGLKPTEPLPFKTPSAAPVISVEQTIIRRAQRYLSLSYPERDLSPGELERSGSHWKVIVLASGVGATAAEPMGHLVLSQSGELLEDAVQPQRLSRSMRAWHYLQTKENSCVPACMCMIPKMRGQSPTEEDFHEGASPRGHAARLALMLPQTRREAPDPGTEDDLQVWLVEHVLLVSVSGHPYARWLATTPALVSPFGPLCQQGDYGGPLHAILLIGWRNGGYEFLDPYFLATNQPLWMASDDFVSCFAGEVVLARR